MSKFVKQTSFGVDYSPTHITKWRSLRTGLQICYINQPSPLVKGYFAVATECLDDTGLPHTLEHLVFMGSKKYPYKGLLDTLGNRFFLETNASTYVDKTVYTLSTAGWEGFKTLLPIYLDHLMNPTLTDEACLTEVYHVSGEGKERGVVFLEMQGIESQSWFVGLLNSQRTTFPPNSGYSSETGGLTNELRTLTNQSIKDFHKAMYRPDNLSVIITGTVDEAELLDIMEQFDAELPELVEGSHKRPFVESEDPPIVPIKESIVKVVEFPEEDESAGEVYLSWIGPKFSDPVLKLAMDIIAGYFTDSEISLFDKHLIEIEDPLVTDIEFSMEEYLNCVLNFTFNGVPTDKLLYVDSKLKELIADASKVESIDLTYLRQLVEQQRLRIVGYTELSPALFKKQATEDFIYGDIKDTELLARFAKDLSSYDELMKWDAEKWASTIKTWFVDNKSITILNTPSAALADSFKKEKKQIGKKIKAKYGKEGLAKLGEQLDHAKAINDKPIPDDILTQFGQPDPSKIVFIDTTSYKAGTNTEVQYDPKEQNPEFVQQLAEDGSLESPLFFHFESYKSQFTDIDVIMPTSDVDPDLLRFMPILREIFSLPLKVDSDGSIMPYEEVIQKLNEDFLLCYATNEFNTLTELMRIKLSFQTVKYDKAIEWLKRCMFDSIFDEKRVKVLLEKLVSSIPSKKRNEEEILESVTNRTMFTKKSIKKAQDFLYTETFLRECLETIDNGNFDSIHEKLEKLRSHVFKLANIKLFFVGNCEGLKNPISTWADFIENADSTTTSVDSTIGGLPHSYQYLSEIGLKCSKYAHIATTSASDSTHLNVSTKISTDPLHEDVKKIELVSAFLSATEGPFWRGLRGEGIAYLCWTSRDLETGLLSFRIYRGSDPQQALIVAKEIVNDFCTGKKKFDKIGIDNAIAQIVLEYAQREQNQQQAANSKILQNIIRQTGPKYPTKSLKKLNQLTEEDLVYTVRKYFQPMFASDNSMIFSCVPGDKIDSLKLFLENDGYNVVVEEIQAEAGGEDDDHHDCSSCEDDSSEGEESEGEESEESESDEEED